MSNIAHKLHRAGQRADELFADQVKGGDITPRQYAVLNAVANSDEPSQTTLVEMTGIDRSTLADIVRRLVERKLLQRKRTRKDARMYAVSLTELGRVALKSGSVATQTTDGKIAKRLGAKNTEELERLLDMLLADDDGEAKLAKAG